MIVTAKIEINNNEKNNGSNLHSYVSFEGSHRLFNPTKINLNLFEIHNEIYLRD